MTQKISNYWERNVINGWLLGKSREKIAAESSVSTGSVSNIINKFKDNLGHCDAETVRELALQIIK